MSETDTGRPWTDHPLNLVAGPVVWSVWFIAVYGGLSVVCGGTPGDGAGSSATRIALASLTGVVIGALCACALASRRAAAAPVAGDGTEVRRFIATAAMALHGVAAVATAFTALPLLAVPPCV